MSEHMFGVRRGKITKRTVTAIERVVDPLDVTFVYTDLPGTGLQSWFCCQNLGHPFDQAKERETYEALRKAGVEGYGAPSPQERRQLETFRDDLVEAGEQHVAERVQAVLDGESNELELVQQWRADFERAKGVRRPR